MVENFHIILMKNFVYILVYNIVQPELYIQRVVSNLNFYYNSKTIKFFDNYVRWKKSFAHHFEL